MSGSPALLVSIVAALACSAVPAAPATPAFEGRAASGGVVVSWRVEDGYRIHLVVDTKARKRAYEERSEVDVSVISADFVDVNADGRMDVLVKLADEEGYSPEVLVAREDGSFERALDHPPFVAENLSSKDGRPEEPPRYRVRSAGGTAELVFPNAVFGGERFRDATYRWDRVKRRFVLAGKGPSLGKVIEAGDGDSP
jgi:hypothetical protein